MGDAIRNGAMRFGVGTYLWSKSEEAERRKLGEAEEPQETTQEQQPQQGPDWQAHYAQAKAAGPERFAAFIGWAKQNNGPAAMIAAGEKELAAAEAVEGEVVNDGTQ